MVRANCQVCKICPGLEYRLPPMVRTENRRKSARYILYNVCKCITIYTLYIDVRCGFMKCIPKSPLIAWGVAVIGWEGLVRFTRPRGPQRSKYESTIHRYSVSGVAVSTRYLRTTRQRVGRAGPRVAIRSGLSHWPESGFGERTRPGDVAAERVDGVCNQPSARHLAALALYRSMLRARDQDDGRKRPTEVLNKSRRL